MFCSCRWPEKSCRVLEDDKQLVALCAWPVEPGDVPGAKLGMDGTPFVLSAVG